MGDLERALGAIPLGNAHVSVDTLNDVQSLRREMGQSAKSALQAQEEMMSQLNQQMHLQARYCRDSLQLRIYQEGLWYCLGGLLDSTFTARIRVLLLIAYM